MKKLLVFIFVFFWVFSTQTIFCLAESDIKTWTEVSNASSIPNKEILDNFLLKIKKLSSEMSWVEYKNKLSLISNKLNSVKSLYKQNSSITLMLSYLSDWINQLQNNSDIITINDILTAIDDDTELKTPSAQIDTTSTNSTIIMSSCKFDECLSNGFYVIKSTNKSYSEWCNSEWLNNPENFCVLKIWDMYVAPKNFTSIASKWNYVLINSSSWNFQVKKALVNDQRLKILPNSIIYDQSISDACNTALKSLNEKDYSSSDEYTKARNNVRNSSVCIAYDRYSSSVAWKTKLSENFACSDLSTFMWNSVKWKQLEQLWWDWDIYSCDENTSNKNWLCSIELNRSKLKLYTDKPYYIWLLSYFYNVPENSVLDTKEELIERIKFSFLWNWNITTVEPLFEIVFTWNSIKDSSWNRVKLTTKKIKWYSFPNWDKWLYELCIWY